MNIQSELSKNKTFKTSNGTVINYSFVNMFSTKLYKDYITNSAKVGPQLMAHAKKIRTPEYQLPADPEKLEEYNQLIEQFNVDGEILYAEAAAINDSGYMIMRSIFESNKQEFKYDNFTDFVDQNFSNEDMTLFISSACGNVSPQIKKK